VLPQVVRGELLFLSKVSGKFGLEHRDVRHLGYELQAPAVPVLRGGTRACLVQSGSRLEPPELEL